MLVVIDNHELMSKDFEFVKRWKSYPKKDKMNVKWRFIVKKNYRIN